MSIHAIKYYQSEMEHTERPDIAERFNTYRFADYKNEVIDLIERVCRVSAETMRITAMMPQTAG